jgi:enamine deaminase RidA (YjgF/YER057c/UK114 family)
MRELSSIRAIRNLAHATPTVIIPEPDFAKQVQPAFDNLAAVLEAAGCTFDDVIDVTTFHTGPAAQFEIFDPIPKRAFGNGPFPTSTAVGAT